MAQAQRKGKPPKTGGGNTIFYIVLGVIAVAGIIAIGYALAGGGTGTAATAPIDLEAGTAQEIFERATPVTLGDPNAPAKIVEFADFQCPGCAAFSLQVKPQFMPYIERGQAQLVYYDMPIPSIHQHAFLASRAARCAGAQELPDRDAWWAMHDKLYREQARWSAEQEAVDDFVDYAAEIGLDRSAFQRCLRSDQFAEVVTANRLLGEQLGVRSTPTVFINNRQIEAGTIQGMASQLLGILREISPAEAGSGQ